MTPQEALDYLEQLCRLAAVPFANHVRAHQAVEVLKTALQKETTDARPE